MKRKISFSLVVVMMLSFVFNALPAQVANAAVNYVTATRTTSESTLYLQEDKESEIGLTIQGTPPVNVVKPNDIMLLLDKSGSMKTDNRFTAMKESANEFLDLVDFSSHEVGVVDYSSEDSVYTKPLSKDKNDVKNYISNIEMGGWTYTNNAIRSAIQELQANGRSDAQPVIILLTDGAATDTKDALQAAQEAKDAGIVFYTIALLGPKENPDTSAPNELMKEMATTAHHHHFVLGSVGLIDIYRAIVKEIGVASAYDVKITEQVAPEFEVVEGSYDSNIPRPTYDKDTNTLTWSMLELKNQALNLGYSVKLKDGVAPGTYKVASSSVITYKDYSGKSCSYTIPNKSITVKNQPLTVESITEPKANIAGGESVTIKGTNFRDGVTVKFASKAATDVTLVDENTITATVPAGTQGKCKVTVTNDDASSGTVDFYYEAEPKVTALTPNVGPFAGGTTVKIDGSYFQSDVKVYFGTEEASACKYYNSTYLLVQTPKAVSEGPVDVTLVNGDGTKTVLTDAFTYNPEIIIKPEITEISPNSGSEKGGESIVITGKNFKSGMIVEFDGNEATIVKKTSTSATVKTPAGTIGKVDVTITNPDGQSVTAQEGYEYIEEQPEVIPAPEITSIDTTSGKEAGGTAVVINGTKFKSGCKVYFGENEARQLNFYGTTKMRFSTPAGTGIVDVKVVNPDGQESVLKDGYTYNAPVPDPAPEVKSVSITEGTTNGGITPEITAANLKSGCTVYFGDNEATILNFYSSSRIRVKVPKSDTDGTVDIRIVNPDGQEGVLADAFTYNKIVPTITSVEAATGKLAGGEGIYINGTEIESKAKVYFGDNEATILNYYSKNRIRVKAPAGDKPGLVDVKIENPVSGVTCVLADAYTYQEAPAVKPPTLSYLSKSGTEASKTTEMKAGSYIQIHGSNMKSGIVVNIYDESGNLVKGDIKTSNFYSATRIRIIIPKALTVGTYKMVLQNLDGQESEELEFNIV